MPLGTGPYGLTWRLVGVQEIMHGGYGKMVYIMGKQCSDLLYSYSLHTGHWPELKLA